MRSPLEVSSSRDELLDMTPLGDSNGDKVFLVESLGLDEREVKPLFDELLVELAETKRGEPGLESHLGGGLRHCRMGRVNHFEIHFLLKVGEGEVRRLRGEVQL